MESASLNIIFGIVSGVITALVLFLGARLWQSTVLPLLKEWKYSGVEISDTWKGADQGALPEGGWWSTEVTLTLNQSTLDVSGLLTIRYRSPKNCFDLSFNAIGKIWEGYVTLSFTPVSRSVTSVATALLKIAGGGTALLGRLVYRNINNDQVDQFFLAMHRSEFFQPTAEAVAPVPAATPAPEPAAKADVVAT